MTDSERWQAVVNRSDESRFVFAVLTTGIVCRASCPARRPKRENVRFFESVADARAAGFRTCKRCTPEAPSLSEKWAETVTQLCRALEREPSLSLRELAERVGHSPFHLQRRFRQTVGVSPRQYAKGVQAGRARQLLTKKPVTEAMYEAGYSSPSRFYAEQLPGVTPRQLAKPSEAGPVSYSLARCSLGYVVVAWTERGVCAVALGASTGAVTKELQATFPQAKLAPREGRFVEAVVKIIERPTTTELPLDVRGTAFQRSVWKAVAKIRPGETMTYAALAKAVGRPRSTRAVANAVGANELAVLIPCHRVTRTDGGLGGYRWGVERKRQLLATEAGERQHAAHAHDARRARSR